MRKVEAVAQNVRRLNGLDVIVHPEQYAGQRIDTPMVVIALDTAHGRQRACRGTLHSRSVEFVVDVASGMNMIRIETFTPAEAERYYAGFRDQEELPLICSGRSVAYNSFVAAGLTAAILKCYAYQQPYPDLLELDMATWYFYQTVPYEKFS